MALLKHSGRRCAVFAWHSCIVSVGLQITVQFLSSILMGNFVSRVRSLFFRCFRESDGSTSIANRFRWAQEQGQDELHLAEGGPLFHRLGTWSCDRGDASAGKCACVCEYSCLEEKRHGVGMMGWRTMCNYCRVERGK